MAGARRVLLTAFSAALFAVAGHAIAALLASGADPYIVYGCVVGVGVAGLWPWSERLLAPAVIVLSVVLGSGLAMFPRSQHAATRVAGAFLEQTGSSPISWETGFALTIGAVCLAACCGWLLVTRHTPWPVVALTGSALLARADVTRVYEDRFLLFMVAAVLLVVCTYAPSMRRLRLVLPAALVGCALASMTWELPTARNAWSPLFADPVASLTGSGTLNGGVTTLNLTGGFHPTNRLIMAVTINRPDVHPYWQTLVFDQYDGHSWMAGDSTQRSVPALSALAPAEGRNSAITSTVQLFQSAQTLISTGTPVRASIPTIALYAPGGFQPVEVRAPNGLLEGMTYEIQGAVDAPFTGSPADLRVYLQLPTEPARLLNLALHLVQKQPSPIDRALAIQSYLRDSGRFSYDVNAGSPADGDAVDAFLFQTHRGYCNQFASAMVILAREVGIPARLISGYDAGTLELGSYLVREKDAHSWAEVYIAGAGWVALDPTPGFDAAPFQPAGVRARVGLGARSGLPKAAPHRPSNGAGWAREQPPVPASPTTLLRPASHHSASPMLASMSILLLLISMGVTYLLWPRSLSQLYLSAVRATPRRYGTLEPGETPLEFAERFRRQRAEHDDVFLLVGLYTRQRYARIEPTEEELRSARQAWRRLRRQWLIGMRRGAP